MKKKRGNNLLSHLFLSVGAFAMIFPLLWLISSTFKNNNEIFSSNFSFIPRVVTWENFRNGWYINPQYSFGHFLWNTIFLVGSLAVGNILSCSLTAFAITRMNFPFKRVVFRLVMLTLMVPSQVLLIPTYLIFSKLRWLDTFLPFIVPAFLSTQSFFVYQLIQYMRGIPKELDESAKIDGCSYFRIYLNIMLPLAKPALISVAIFSFVWTWNDFLTQLIYLNSVRNYTVSLILNSVVDSTSLTNWGALMALTLISVLPCIVIYFSAQRYFVEGIATSGLKG